MDIKFKEDENGKIVDSDELFDKIDGQIDNDEFEAVVSEILSIPREKWSNKLRFRLICAYNNLGEFDKSEEVLGEAAKNIASPNDAARCNYYRGHMCFMNDREIMARKNYMKAAELDPEYAKEIDLEDDINECNRIISEDLAGFHALGASVCEDIKKRFAKSSEKRDISDEEFQTRLGFFPGIRKIPGFEHPMGFEKYFDEYKGEDRENCLKWFDDLYGITDSESFFRHIQTNLGCNLERTIYDVAAYLVGKPNFDIEKLDEVGRFAFESTSLFTGAFMEYLPKAGVLAWDISEKIGFARHAHSCGIISNEDYCKGMLVLSDKARKGFSSWEDYMLSLIFGAGLYMFIMEEWSISAAGKFVLNMLPFLLNGDLADVVWRGTEDSGYDREKYKNTKKG